MIGVSLPLACLEKSDLLFAELWDRGVRSVELQGVSLSTEPESVASHAAELSKYGFQIVIDLTPFDVSASPSEVLAPLSRLWAGIQQKRLPVVIHVTHGTEMSHLRNLAEYAQQNAYPILFLLSDETGGLGSGLESLLTLTEAIDRQNVAICLDIDQHASVEQKEQLAVRFGEKARQKHMAYIRLHGGSDEDGKEIFAYPLQAYLTEFCHKYFGVYNITLDSLGEEKLDREKNELWAAVDQVKSVMPLCAKLYDDLREHFDSRFMHALSMFDGSKKGTHFALIQSSSFLFCSDGFRWGMDVAFRGAYRLAKTPKQAATLLADLDLMIISHGHSDHFEERTVRALAQNPTQWIIPDFLAEEALSRGIAREKMITARVGETIRVGPLSICPFLGKHFRPFTGKGIDEYGYHISVENGPSMAFPVDTRDFSLRDIPNLPKADYCFANVWLGDSCGNATDHGERLAEFARFMLHFSEKNILFAHLYECDRKEKDMWRDEHAELLADTIHQINSETCTIIPHSGEIYELG